ncbi:MAG: membrane protein insertion efficiency factor YidD [Sphaerochaetaceae bacterium]|jgi:putative membrane protein insertion efficiency factor|nr:membrane protein insertion efficiency factor YidD [Sphaerochaetaceae bacterium]HHU88686.1 membrane protein insertion efficiency factor YidD [Spirochaetales bacterium]
MSKVKRVFLRVIREIILIPTHIYRVVISPLLPPSCIYTPSCSTYMLEAVRRHGIFKGSSLGLARIGRCYRSRYIGGSDPVPEEFSYKAIKEPYTIFRKRKS